MKHVNLQHGVTLLPILILIVWVLACMYAVAWVAETVGYAAFQSAARFIGLAVAAGSVVLGYLLSSLKDLRKQLKDDAAFLSRRQVANLNHRITRAHNKTVVMILFYPVTALFMAFSSLWGLDPDCFEIFVHGSGLLVGLCLAFTFLAAVHLWEVSGFEEKLSNAAKGKKSSAQLLSEFRKEKK